MQTAPCFEAKGRWFSRFYGDEWKKSRRVRENLSDYQSGLGKGDAEDGRASNRFQRRVLNTIECRRVSRFASQRSSPTLLHNVYHDEYIIAWLSRLSELP
jgi:hypothetical protein